MNSDRVSAAEANTETKRTTMRILTDRCML
jgi:hypothetical protein